jgi:hypothetical protein
MEPRHIIRAAIAVSVAGHLALAVGVYFADARPFDPSATQDIAVDMVTPEQVAEVAREADKTPPPEPEKQPDPFRLPELTNKPTLNESKPQGSAAPKPPASSPPPSAQQQTATQSSQQQPSRQPPPQQQQQASQEQAAQQAAQQGHPEPQPQAQPPATAQQPPQAQQQPPPQQQASLQPPAEPSSSPPPAQPEPDITVKYGVMLGLPDGNGGAAAIAKADIAPLDIDAFRRHLRTCLKLPSAVSRGDNVRIVLRAFLSPAGKLITEPMLIEASASAKGPLLMQAAMKALETCQPYAMLPADKYNEWKVLDLPFTPQDFAG